MYLADVPIWRYRTANRQTIKCTRCDAVSQGQKGSQAFCKVFILCYLDLPWKAGRTLWAVPLWCEIRSVSSLESVFPASCESSQKQPEISRRSAFPLR